MTDYRQVFKDLRHDLINIMQTPDVRESRGEGMSAEETARLVSRYREIVHGLGIWDALKDPPLSTAEAGALRGKLAEMTKLADAAMARHLEMLERAEAAESRCEVLEVMLDQIGGLLEPLAPKPPPP